MAKLINDLTTHTHIYNIKHVYKYVYIYILHKSKIEQNNEIWKGMGGDKRL